MKLVQCFEDMGFHKAILMVYKKRMLIGHLIFLYVAQYRHK